MNYNRSSAVKLHNILLPSRALKYSFLPLSLLAYSIYFEVKRPLGILGTKQQWHSMLYETKMLLLVTRPFLNSVWSVMLLNSEGLS